jgi:diguanylate cyclase (GGDEF)-like protein
MTRQVHPDDAPAVEALVRSLIKGETAFYAAEHRVRTSSGDWIWVRSQGQVVERDSGGRAVRVSGTNADITERKKSEQALKEAYERLGSGVRTLERRNREITLLAELSNFLLSCVTVEEACDAIPRYGEALFPDAQCALFLMRSSRDYLTAHASWGGPAGDYPPFKPEACWALRRGRIHAVADPAAEPICAHVAPAHGASHRPYLCVPLIVQSDLIGLLWLSFSPGTALSGERAAEEHGNRQLAVALSEQIALAVSNIRLRENLRQQTIRDPLTGLYNRRFLEESLNREIARSKRSGARFALLVIDVDHFKRFNDTYGHDAGDSVLHSVGRALQDTRRQGDIVCRYGGEEFVIVLPDTDRQGATVVSTRVLQMVRSLNLSHGGRDLGQVTVSLGLATFPENGDTAKTIIQSADKALYAAKGAGRDRMMAAGEEPASIQPVEQDGSKGVPAAIEAPGLELRGRRKPVKSRH